MAAVQEVFGMRFVSRSVQDQLSETARYWRRPATRLANDAYFDGEPLPREIAARHWTLEGDVHEARRIARVTDSTRYFTGPHVTILRDDMRRITWAATVERNRLLLTEYLQPAASESERGRETLAEGGIWRYHIALNKYSGRVSATWIVQANGDGAELWHDGRRLDTEARAVDFPFFGLSQVPIGLVQASEPGYGILGYKCRETGRLFVRRVEGEDVRDEQVVTERETVGGISFGIIGDDVLGRVDLLEDGRLVPALLKSDDGGLTFSKPRSIDLSEVDPEFVVRPGFQRPIVDKGGAFHIPIGLESAEESLALNHVLAAGLLVEAIRVKGRLRKTELEVFPSTLGSGNTFGNGVSDGHGLIMALNTENGYLFSSNSSAGGSHFPDAELLNHEMPLVAAFSASECYSSGLKRNAVSMDYLYIEANNIGRPVSCDVFIETWDMPLPLPYAKARSERNKVHIEILNDADLEPGKVTFNFDDPSINITDVEIHDLRTATVITDTSDLSGKVLAFDVLTLFHRHYGEALIEQ
jgi:hypothetical protein